MKDVGFLLAVAMANCSQTLPMECLRVDWKLGYSVLSFGITMADQYSHLRSSKHIWTAKWSHSDKRGGAYGVFSFSLEPKTNQKYLFHWNKIGNILVTFFYRSKMFFFHYSFLVAFCSIPTHCSPVRPVVMTSSTKTLKMAACTLPVEPQSWVAVETSRYLVQACEEVGVQ